MPPSCNFRSPAKTYATSHAVAVNQSGAGGAIQGSWDVPSAHSIDRTAAQVSVTDQFDAATKIQQQARGYGARSKLAPEVAKLAPGHNIYDLASYNKLLNPVGPSPVGRAGNSFELRDQYAMSPYGQGYDFVNNRHDQFGSTEGFNESVTSALADPKPTAQMRVKSGYTGHVPKGRDHIGSTYRMHDNRGTAGKTMVPIPNKDIAPPNDEYLAKMKRNMTYFAGQSAVFQGRMTGGTGSGFSDKTDSKSTVKIPDRIEKLLEREDMKGPDGTMATADIGDEHDSKYVKGTGAPNRMAGYTGHVRLTPCTCAHAARVLTDCALEGCMPRCRSYRWPSDVLLTCAAARCIWRSGAARARGHRQHIQWSYHRRLVPRTGDGTRSGRLRESSVAEQVRRVPIVPRGGRQR